MIDSDSYVNRDVGGFGILIHSAGTRSGVGHADEDELAPRNRDDVVSSYVRMRIRQWRETKELQDLARLAGFAKSTPSQVLLGTGVGAKTGPRFASAFGFPSFDAMKAAAWEWWKAEGAGGADFAAGAAPPAAREAVEAVLGLGQGTPEQLETILAAYTHSRFHDRDRDWWISTLLDELRADREALRLDRSNRKTINATHREMQATREKARPTAPVPPKRRRHASG